MRADAILEELQRLSSLGDVIRWATSREPRADFVDVIVQDEFNHDVVVRLSSAVFAVFEAS